MELIKIKLLKTDNRVQTGSFIARFISFTTCNCTWSCFGKNKEIFMDKNLPLSLKRQFFNQCITLECDIEPILMYGCEAWTISKQAQKKLEAVEMWFLRRMMKISWMAKK